MLKYSKLVDQSCCHLSKRAFFVSHGSFGSSLLDSDLLAKTEEKQKPSKSKTRWYYDLEKGSSQATRQLFGRLRRDYGDQVVGSTVLPESLKEERPAIPSIEGEVLFGLHPVKAALLAPHRSKYKLLVKMKPYSPATIPTSDNDDDNDTNKAMLQDILRLAELRNVPYEIVPPYVLNTLSQFRPHQGVCLDVSPVEYLHLDDAAITTMKDERRSPSVWLYLDRILDPMNFGAILRTSFYLGVDGLFIEKNYCCRITPTVSKASSGAVEWFPIYHVDSAEEAIGIFRRNNFKILGSVSDSEQTSKIATSDSYSSTSDVLLLVGNEGMGLRPKLLDLCDSFITIRSPRAELGSVDSLNVSVATGAKTYTRIN